MNRSTALFKQINFSYSNIQKLRKSIKHSLQLIDKIHFNQELTDRSWLYSGEDKKHLLTTSLEDRRKIVEEVVQGIRDDWKELKLEQQNQRTVSEDERLKITKTISKRRSDLAQEIKKPTYTDQQRNVVSQLLSGIKKPSKDNKETNFFSKPVPPSAKKKIEKSLTGKSLKLAKKIIELHEARLEKDTYQQASFGRTTVMQESIFKLPLHNKVELQEDDYHNIVESFLSKYFPDHELKLAFYHGNEKAKGEKDYNAHTHVFLSGLNSKTRKYDLLDRTREVANIYAQQNGLEPVGKGLEEASRMGEYRQKLFYEHAQNYLNEHKRDVELYVLPATEERRLQREEIRKDANRPKSERKFNQYNLQRENAVKRNKSLKKQEEKLKTLEAKLEKREAELRQQEEELKMSLKNYQIVCDELRELNIESEKKLKDFATKLSNFLTAAFQFFIAGKSKVDAPDVQARREELKKKKAEARSELSVYYTDEDIDKLENLFLKDEKSMGELIEQGVDSLKQKHAKAVALLAEKTVRARQAKYDT